MGTRHSDVATADRASERVTRGDAQAVLEAFGGGGWAIRLNAPVIEGAPADFMPDSKARISPSALYSGRHYCALDFHVISVAIVEGNAEGETLSNQEIMDRIAARNVEIFLDGAPLVTERTTPRRTTNPGFREFVEAFYVQQGRIMAPEDLSPGPHNLRAIGNRFGFPPQVIGDIVFVIDAPGTGACA